MQIVKSPSPILTQKAKPVVKFDKKLQKTIEQMTTLLAAARNPEGVGLAAPQVGLSKRIFIIQTNPSVPPPRAKYQPFINPEIIPAPPIQSASANSPKPAQSNSKNPASGGRRPAAGVLEGCLSIDNVWGFPDRKKTVKLTYKNLLGKKHTQIFTGFPARLVQHELDHLNGILFTRRVIEQNKRLYQIEEDEKTNEPALVPLDI